jgi:His-Xaa-Ser system protein HxsD
MIYSELDERTLQIIIDKSQYSTQVVHKCFYWYADKYSVHIREEGNSHIINLSNSVMNNDLDLILNKVKNDLIDFKTREIVNLETKNIRELLIAKAFARGDEFDEVPPGNTNDPLGFDAALI